MAGVNVTTQMIKEYRALMGNFILSDSAILEMIKKDIETGKLPKEFATLATDAQKVGYNANTSNLFGFGFNTNTAMGLSFERTTPKTNQNEQQAKKIASPVKENSKWYKDWGGSSLVAECKKTTKYNILYILKEFEKISPDKNFVLTITDNTTISVEKQKEALKHIFNVLCDLAKDKGVDTTHFEKTFKTNISQTRIETVTNRTTGGDSYSIKKEVLTNDNITTINNIIVGLRNSIEIKTNPNAYNQIILFLTPEEQIQEQTIISLKSKHSSSLEAIENQNRYDGWTGELADWMSGAWGSKNREKHVRADLEKFNAQIAELEEAKKVSKESFEKKFEEIFGIKYDAELIVHYQQVEQLYQKATSSYQLEQFFKSDLNVLLSNSTLREETKTVSIDPMTSFTQTTVLATKEQVFEREFNKLANFVGESNLEKGKQKLEEALKSNGITESSTLQEKYIAIRKIAQDYVKALHDNTMQVTGNKGYEAIAKDFDDAYKSAFGVTNDIARRVTEYNVSQQAGAGVIKSIVMIVGTTALGAATGGAGLSFFPTLVITSLEAGAITATTEFSDRLSSGYVIEGFKDIENGLGGVIEGVKQALPDEEITRILISSGITSLTVAAGGMLGAGVEIGAKTIENALVVRNLVNILTGGEVTANISNMIILGKTAMHVVVGTGVGAAAEYLHTGTVSIEGVVFAFVFSAVGQLIALTKIGVMDNGKVKFDKQTIQQARQDLGLDDDVVLTEKVLKKAYRKMAVQTHPDRGGTNEAFNRVCSAYDLLTKYLNSTTETVVTTASSKTTAQTTNPTTTTTNPTPPVEVNPNLPVVINDTKGTLSHIQVVSAETIATPAGRLLHSALGDTKVSVEGTTTSISIPEVVPTSIEPPTSIIETLPAVSENQVFIQKRQALLDMLYAQKQQTLQITKELITPENIDIIDFVVKTEGLRDNYQVLSMAKAVNSEIQKDFALKFLAETFGKVEVYDNGLSTVVQSVTTQELSDLYLNMTKMLLSHGIEKSPKGLFSSLILSTKSNDMIARIDGIITKLSSFCSPEDIYSILSFSESKHEELYSLLKEIPDKNAKTAKVYDVLSVSMKKYINGEIEIEEMYKLVSSEVESLYPNKSKHIFPVINDVIIKKTPSPTYVYSEEDINNIVSSLLKEYSANEKLFHDDMVKLGFSDIGLFEDRIKSEASLRAKVVNYLKEHSIAVKDSVIAEVRDMYACRSILKTQDLTQHPEVKSLIESGDIAGAMLRAAEIQAEPAVECLKNLITAQAEGKSTYSISRISNYVAKDGIPYFSENQLAELRQFAASKGIKINIVERIAEGDELFSEVSEVNAKPTTRSQPSGYTSFQINLTTEDGKIIEWQCRGDLVSSWAEAEHLAYDFRTDKGLIGIPDQLKPLYQPYENLLSKTTMPEDIYNAYNRYLNDYYTHLRKLELGFESEEPRLSDYEINGYKFDERLVAKNLIKLHDVTQAYKADLISVNDAYYLYKVDAIKVNAIKNAYLTDSLNSPNAPKPEIPEVLKEYLSKISAQRCKVDPEFDKKIDSIIQQGLDHPEALEYRIKLKTGEIQPTTLFDRFLTRTQLEDHYHILFKNRSICEVIEDYLAHPAIFSIKDRIYTNNSVTEIPQRIVELVKANPGYAVFDIKSGVNIDEIILEYLTEPEVFEIKQLARNNTKKPFVIDPNDSFIKRLRSAQVNDLTDFDSFSKSISASSNSNSDIPSEMKDFIARNPENARIDENTGIEINAVIKKYLESPEDFNFYSCLRELMHSQINDISPEIAQKALAKSSMNPDGTITRLTIEDFSAIRKIALRDVELAEWLLDNDNILNLEGEKTIIRPNDFIAISDLLDNIPAQNVKILLTKWHCDTGDIMMLNRIIGKHIVKIDKALRAHVSNPDKLKISCESYRTMVSGDNFHIELVNVEDNSTYRFNIKTGELVSVQIKTGEFETLSLNVKNNTVTETTALVGETTIKEARPRPFNSEIKLPAVTDFETIVYGNENVEFVQQDFMRSEITGEYNIYGYTADGKKFQLGFAEIGPNGEKFIERTLTSLDGTKTEYVYRDDTRGNRYLFSRITDSEGQVLSEVKRTFRVVDENHFITSTNGEHSEVVFFDDKVVITKLDANKQRTSQAIEYKIVDFSIYETDRELKIGTRMLLKIADEMKIDLYNNSPDNLENLYRLFGEYYKRRGLDKTIDKRLLPLLKQLSGEEWLKLDLANLSSINYIYGSGYSTNAFALGNSLVAVGENLSNFLSVVEHEFGHVFFIKLKLYEDPELVRIYNAERMNFITTFDSDFLSNIEYFVNDATDNTGYRGLNEVAAESNFLMNMHSQSQLQQTRSIILHQYFPRTLAYITEKISLNNFSNGQ